MPHLVFCTLPMDRESMLARINSHWERLGQLIVGNPVEMTSITNDIRPHSRARTAHDYTLKLWDPKTGNCIRTFHLLPENQWATIHEPTASATGHERGSIRYASPEAWRWLGWLVHDRPNEIPRRVSIEAFGPIPGLEVAVGGS